MEDVKAYIESGILELYVLGDLSAEEKRKVEAMALKYSAVKAELEDIENSLEEYATLNEVQPSENLRNRVLNSLITNLGDDKTFKAKTKSELAHKVVNLTTERSGNFYKYAFAASLALLILSTVSLFTVYNKWQSVQGQLFTAQLQNQKFATRVRQLKYHIGIFQDPSFRMVRLVGTAKTPDAKIMVGFVPTRKMVMIDMVHSKMPKTDPSHSYQLWAMVNGKPVDLGIFSTSEDTIRLKRMRSIDTAEAFAVTVEPRGGSPVPTLSNMMAIGKIN